jgi:hypothetical protein
MGPLKGKGTFDREISSGSILSVQRVNFYLFIFKEKGEKVLVVWLTDWLDLPRNMVSISSPSSLLSCPPTLGGGAGWTRPLFTPVSRVMAARGDHTAQRVRN